MNLTRLFWTFQLSSWVLITALIAKYSPENSPYSQYKWVYYMTSFCIGLGSTTLYAYLHKINLRQSVALRPNLIWLFSGTFAIAFIFFISDVIYFNWQTTGQNYKSFYNYLLLYFDDFWLVFPWFLFFHFLHFARLSFRQQQKLAIAQNQLKVVELEVLKKQLNPHFLFNALNSIKALTLIEPLTARDALTELSELLRLILNLEEQKKIVFGEELKMSEHYLALEKMRFDNRLKYAFYIQDEAKYATVVPMVLQTLIENAVKHGISKAKKGGVIEIYASVENRQLVLRVKNTGQYLPNLTPRKGIGTNNLKRRLELTYGDEAIFEVNNLSRDMVEATVRLPLEDLTVLLTNENK